MFPEPTYPTPVVECSALSRHGVTVWLKNDGATHAVYGGNKVRKATRLVQEAERRGASRILTFGAIGSHHVLTLGLFARARGLPVAAIVMPQPVTEHVIETLRASAGQGVELYPVRGAVAMPASLAVHWKPSDYVVPPGGSNAIGTEGYVDAALELAAQVRANLLPEPDVVVTPVGTGGTVAGLLAGLSLAGLRSRVLGVLVVRAPLSRTLCLRLARRALASRGSRPEGSDLGKRLDLVDRYVGDGYGHPTPEAEHALRFARDELGLALDLTYTAKAFAAVLDLASGGRSSVRNVLYWHTLSSVPIRQLLEDAPRVDELPKRVKTLLNAAGYSA